MCFRKATWSPRVFSLPFGLYTKCGAGVTVTEAIATQYVEANTTIPVPTILDVLADENKDTFILMTSVPGISIGRQIDLNTCSDRQHAVFTETLRDWLEQLRALPSPHGDKICNFAGGSFFSNRITWIDPIGPFESQNEFHAQRCCTSTLR